AAVDYVVVVAVAAAAVAAAVLVVGSGSAHPSAGRQSNGCFAIAPGVKSAALLQRAALRRNKPQPPKKQLQIKETEGLSWASETAWPICLLFTALLLKIAVSPARQRLSQEQGKHKPSRRQAPAKQAANNPRQHPA
ncbi:unnamed protein product, partial [Polarella glacialis]